MPNRLPKLTNHSGVSDGKGGLLPPISNSSIKIEKESQKMKEISKAYKVNIGQLDELKERYRNIKKIENPIKREKY